MERQTGAARQGAGGKEARGVWGYLDVGVKLASSAMPEGVGAQLPIQARHDRVAGGAVSVVKAVVSMQS